MRLLINVVVAGRAVGGRRRRLGHRRLLRVALKILLRSTCAVLQRHTLFHTASPLLQIIARPCFSRRSGTRLDSISAPIPSVFFSLKYEKIELGRLRLSRNGFDRINFSPPRVSWWIIRGDSIRKVFPTPRFDLFFFFVSIYIFLFLFFFFFFQRNWRDESRDFRILLDSSSQAIWLALLHDERDLIRELD